MKKVLPTLVLIFICIILMDTFPSVISACSCADLPSVEEEFERSKAVFSGKVVSVTEKRNLSKSVLFEVTNTWKGVEQSQIIITTGQGGGDCGIAFKEGQEYLVYATESTMYGKKSLVSIICDRTNLLNSLKEDLKILGEGQPPIEKVDLISKQQGTDLNIWIAICLAIGIVLIFTFYMEKR